MPITREKPKKLLCNYYNFFYNLLDNNYRHYNIIHYRQRRQYFCCRVMISYELMQEPAIMQFEQCGAQDCSSALLDACNSREDTHNASE